MSDPKDKEKKTGRSSGMRTGTGKSTRGDAVLQKKARQLTDDFAKDPFIAKDSAAMELLKLRDTLKNMVQNSTGDMQTAAKELLGQTEQIISTAKKTGKVSAVATSAAAITQKVNALSKEIDSLENKLGGYKAKYVMDYQKNLQSFEQKWMVQFPGTVLATPVKDAADKEKEKFSNVHNWDEYMNVLLGDNVEKGKEKEYLAKAMAGVILKQENKPFSLEEADKMATNILKSKAFEETFGKNGRLVEDYLKNRNISQAILLMDAQIDKGAVKKLQKEQDKKYKEFNKFLQLHPALKLGYEVMSKKDATEGTSNAEAMVNDYHQAKAEGDEMTEARIMTKLLKEADPVLQAARNNPQDEKSIKEHLEGKGEQTERKLPTGAQATELVLVPKEDWE